MVFGDTRRVQRGMGTFASRSAVVCGPAITLACDRVTAKAREIAAWMPEAPADDIELEDGRFTIAGTDRSLAFGDIARAPTWPRDLARTTGNPASTSRDSTIPMTSPGRSAPTSPKWRSTRRRVW